MLAAYPRAVDTAPDLIRALLTSGAAPPPEQPDLEAWWPAWREAGERWADPFDRAVAAGAAADRVAWAFAGGYQAALRRLVPGLPPARLACLAATEAGGAHPRQIEARLSRVGEGWRLDGRKQWATLSDRAGLFLVVASVGREGGRNRLKLVRVERGDPGVSVSPQPPFPAAPEILHGRLAFDAAPLPDDRLLPGDGYSDYLKRFRTIEDVHVVGALLGHWLRVALCSGWPPPARAELAFLIEGLRALSRRDDREPVTHVALAGFFTAQARAMEALAPHWALAAAPLRERWARDAPLLAIASRARAARARAAWARLG